MKIYFLILWVALLGAQTIDAFPQRNEIVPDCNQCDDGETLPDANSCSQYYLCVGGKALRKRCALGLYYDAKSGLCNRAFLVDCAINRFGQRVNHFIHSIPDIEIDYEYEEEEPAHTVAPPCDKHSTTTTPCTTTTKTTTCSTTTTSTTPCPTTTPCKTTKPTTTPCKSHKTRTTTCSTTTCKPTKRTATTCKPTRPTKAPCSPTTPPCTTTKRPCSTTTTPCTTTTHSPKRGTYSKDKHPQCLKSSNDCVSLNDGTRLLDCNHCRRYYVCTDQRPIRQICRPGYWVNWDTLTCRPRNEVTNCSACRN